jgi:hypothetical protein
VAKQLLKIMAERFLTELPGLILLLPRRLLGAREDVGRRQSARDFLTVGVAQP